MIPESVAAAFGLRGEPVALDGGAGTSVLLDGVVCKPADAPDVAAWCQEVAELPGSDTVRCAPPLRARDGAFVVDGWTASIFIPGLVPLDDQPTAVIAHADAVTDLLSHATRPLPHRTDRWARGIDAAYGHRIDRLNRATHALLDELLALAGAAPHRDTVVHADMTGNTFLDADGSVVILDLSPAPASRGFAAAVVVADHLLWRDAPPDLAHTVAADDLARALAFRLVSEQLAHDPRHGARVDDYRDVLTRITP